MGKISSHRLQIDRPFAWLAVNLALVCTWQVRASWLAMGVSVAAGFLIVMLGIDLVLGRVRTPTQRECLGAALVVFLWIANYFGYEQCPHATYLHAGGTVITLSGKQCGNIRPTHTAIMWLTDQGNPWHNHRMMPWPKRLPVI